MTSDHDRYFPGDDPIIDRAADEYHPDEPEEEDADVSLDDDY